MTLITLQSISKSFRGQVLFQNASAQFERGNIYGITGPNGSGKSVLFKMICGFINPDEGTIKIDPNYREATSQFLRKVGIIVDRPGYIGGLTGFLNLKRLASIQQLISDEHIKQTMLLVGLQPDSTTKVRNYSLGMKQKLSIAQAIMENQEILILDEPFNALDADSVKLIRQLLISFREQGKTIILSSHNQDDINLLCDKVYTITRYHLEEVE